jgi:D-glycero-D-manno-heptose 1,7-bisphosphate phosphatase
MPQSPPTLRNCLFLDRDGVVNECIVREGKPYPPATAGEIRYIPGIHSLCHRAKSAGWLVIIATNQPDVGRGTTPLSSVEEIHAKIARDLAVDEIKACYDPGRGEESLFRKPAPGMLLEAARQHGIDLAASYMIGDRWRDVACGLAAGCKTIFIDYGYSEQLTAKPDFTVPSLAAAAALLPF